MAEQNIQYSPGTWEVKEVMGKKFVAAPAYEGHPHFGHTRFVDIAGDEDYPCKDADLSLIAAAPDLLEALKSVMAATPHSMCHDAAAWVRAEAAIRKATEAR